MTGPIQDEVLRALEERVTLDSLDWMVVCGSGLGRGLVAPDGLALTVEATVLLQDLGLPAPSVQGHGHALVFGRIGASRVCLQTGRLHPYEGHPVRTCVAALEAVLGRWHPALVLTCAAGALRQDLAAGQLVSLRDQINLLGPTPLQGPRFVDCSSLYDPKLRARLADAGRAVGESLEEVVYAHARGPQYETPAEVEALRRLGGEIVGMSTTYEAILAASLGVATCGVGVVTNAAGASDLSHEEVQERSEAARGRLVGVLDGLLASAP